VTVIKRNKQRKRKKFILKTHQSDARKGLKGEDLNKNVRRKRRKTDNHSIDCHITGQWGLVTEERFVDLTR